jgi:carboxypeptidase family protein
MNSSSAFRRAASLFVLTCWLIPAAATAQTLGGGIAGIVSDTSGAVLPGVSVEASSPVLIEKTRVAISDTAGRFSVVNLPPGTYTVTFTLQGFTTLRREGITIDGTFTATVNGELRVGTVSETITVAGQAPVVDVQNTNRQFVATKDALDGLPASRSLQGQANLIPGYTGASFGAAIHGSTPNDTYIYNDGMRGGSPYGTGNVNLGWQMNQAASAELTYDTSGQSAEIQVSGIRMNAIPKEGGNTFAGTIFAFGASSGMTSDNRSDDVKQVLRDANRLAYAAEINPAFGGPIQKDKLWFLAGGVITSNKTWVADTYFPNGGQAYTATLPNPNFSYLLRLTSQLSPRNKVRVEFDQFVQGVAYSSVGAVRSATGGGNGVQPVAAFDARIPQGKHVQAKWTSPATSRLLLEAQASSQYEHWYNQYQPGRDGLPKIGPMDIGHVDLSTGRVDVAATTNANQPGYIRSAIASATYVTGSHSLKAGLSQVWGNTTDNNFLVADIAALNFIGTTPNSVTVTNQPNGNIQNLNADLGVYVQDRWAVGRATLNLGWRWDHFNSSIPEQTAAAGRFVPARHFAAIPNVPNWNDGSFRLGVAYDLFGTGKTAVKANAGKFVLGNVVAYATARNPLAYKSETRTWRDLNGDGTVLNSDTTVQYNEIGPALNSNFGVDLGTPADPNLPRTYNWEESVALEHQLRQGFAVAGAYYHRKFYNLTWTQNRAVDPLKDYTPFTIVGPKDSRLPNGGGELITLYNLNPNKLGQVDNFLTVSDTNTQVYDGIELTTNARLPHGAFFFGGVTIERYTAAGSGLVGIAPSTASNLCQVPNPNSLRFCDNTPPFRPIFKMSAMYPLPYGIQLAGNLQVRPGPAVSAVYTVTSAIAGVPLTGVSALSVQLIEPNTMILDYQKQVDFRISRKFGQFRPLLDIYNAFNAGTVIQVNPTYGPSWLRPQSILNGRSLRFGAEYNF